MPTAGTSPQPSGKGWNTWHLNEAEGSGPGWQAGACRVPAFSGIADAPVLERLINSIRGLGAAMCGMV